MKRTILLIIILLSTYSFKLSAQIIKKYKDGVSIDSLVEKWPRLNYNEVVAMLKEQGIEYIESSFPSTDIFDKKIMVIDIVFYKVFYKGIFIGDGKLTFESGTGKARNNKNSYILKSFRSDVMTTSEYKITPIAPQSKDIMTAYLDLRSFYLKRYGKPEGSNTGEDSVITPESDPKKVFEDINTNNKSIGYRWTVEDTKDKMSLFLKISHIDPLWFMIHWYPEFEPEKKKMKGKKQ